MFRFRKSRLPWPAVGLLLFIGIILVVLSWQLITLLSEPGRLDWLLTALLVATLLLFLIMGLAVLLLDFEQKLLLLRDGIYIMPSVFAAYKIKWNDIERLELREGSGFRLIEYRLIVGSPSYEARVKQAGKRRLLATEGRNGGFHGAIPVQAYNADNQEMSSTTEQNNIRANRLFSTLHRFWINEAARAELPE